VTVNVTVPELGESVLEATVGEWHRQEGDMVAIGDVLVDLETDKVDVEVGAESAGVLVSIEEDTGNDVQIGDVLAKIDPDDSAAADADRPTESEEADETEDAPEAEPEKPAEAEANGKGAATPVAQRLADEKGVDLSQVEGSGTNGRITRQDVEKHLKEQDAAKGKEQEAATEADAAQPSSADVEPPSARGQERQEERVRLTRRRAPSSPCASDAARRFANDMM